jgi:hypothetical protein
MRVTTIKRRFIIEQYNTNADRYLLYDTGVIVGRIIKVDGKHVINLHKGSALANLSADHLSDLLCMLRQLDIDSL